MAELQAEAESAEKITDVAVDIDAALSAVAREAWVSVGASDASSAQHVRALNTALAAVARRADVLQSLGLLKKVSDKMALTFDPIGLSDEEIKQLLKQSEQRKEDKTDDTHGRGTMGGARGTERPQGLD